MIPHSDPTAGAITAEQGPPPAWAGTADWFTDFTRSMNGSAEIWRNRDTPALSDYRSSAVLMLLAEGESGPDVLLTKRASTLRKHAGQVSFPGGACDPGETPAQTALREATEEVGLNPASVELAGALSPIGIPPTRFAVTPVLGWWREPHPVRVVDPAEVESVVRLPLADLRDPAVRFIVQHPSGFRGPAFEVHGLYIWGLTAGLIAHLLRTSGWDQSWDENDVRDLRTT